MPDQVVVEPQSELRNTEPSPSSQRKPRYRALLVVGIVLVVGTAIAFAVRLGERRALAKETEVLAVPSVVVIQPKPEPAQQELILPSTLEAYTESPIYARTSGYLAHWYKDI